MMELVCEKLVNRNGVEATFLNRGATLMNVSVPDKAGGHMDLTLGYGSAGEYADDRLYFGATPGRFAGLVSRAGFALGGREYRLSRNYGRHHLHGGETGFARRLWETRNENGAVTFAYASADGENGYPGTLTAQASYTLNDDNELIIKYAAVSDADTVVNLTNHAYFNLDGGKGDTLGHALRLHADSFIVADDELIPTGEIRETAGGPMDFSSARRIGDAIAACEEAFPGTRGIDASFVVNGDRLRRAAILSGSLSGVTLEVDTDMPVIHVYTAHDIPEGTKGRSGLVYGPYSGVCLEAQCFDDAPNQPGFPSAALKKGERFSATIVYRFVF